MKSSQALWVLDPRNRTGLADDANDGTDALHPLLSWNGGIVPKLGKDPILTAPITTFQFLSGSPPGGTDPIGFSPTLQGALVFQGDFSEFQKVSSGTILGLTAKDYVAGTLLTANLGPLAQPNMAVVNTTVGKESLAWIRSVTGGIASMSQAMTRQQAPYLAIPPAYVDNWADGDSFDLYLPDSIQLVALTPMWGDTRGKAYIQRLGLGANFGSASPATALAPGVFMFESRCDRATGWEGPFTRTTIISNCAFTDTTVGVTAGTFNTGNIVLFVETPFVRFWGGFGAINLTGGLLDGNFIAIPIKATAASVRGCTLGNVFLEGTLLSEGRTSMNQYDFDPTRLWGPGVLEIDDGRVSIYGATAASSLLQLGGVGLGTSTQKTGYVVTPTGWTPGIATTPANIDLYSTPNGVGVFLPSGGSIGIGAGL